VCAEEFLFLPCLVFEDSVAGLIAADGCGNAGDRINGRSHCRSGGAERLLAAEASDVAGYMRQLHRLA
jgi:beta-phosphoglucomutase-like phosphatase (HAD superfamily)